LNQNLNENIRGFHFRNGDWLSMTPEGYFHGSNNAGRFLNARSKRKVLSINQFFHDLHRPDLVYLKHQNKQQFKTSKKTNIAIQLKKAKPPYIKSVEQLKPLNNNEVQIKTILENEGSGFGDIFYWLNGKLVATKKIDFISSKTIEIKQSIKLPTGNSQLSVTATNAENKLVSNKKILMLKNTSVIKPVLYVLTASHDKYVNLPSSIELKHSHWDARYFAKIIKQHNKKSYQQVVVESLIGQSFTNDGINKSVKKVKQKMQENDALIIYLTGLTNHDASDFYYLPMNATKLSTSPNNQISIKQLAHQFDHTDSQKIVMLLNINPSQSIKGINNNHISMQYRNIIQHINKQTGVNILLIPKIDQLIDLAFEEKSKMTLFVNQMLRNSDKLGNKDGLISLKELFLYFKNNYDLGDISSQSQFNEFDFVLMKEK